MLFLAVVIGFVTGTLACALGFSVRGAELKPEDDRAVARIMLAAVAILTLFLAVMSVKLHSYDAFPFTVLGAVLSIPACYLWLRRRHRLARTESLATEQPE